MNMPVVKACRSRIRVNVAMVYGNCRSSVYAEPVSVAVGKCRYGGYVVNMSRCVGLG